MRHSPLLLASLAIVLTGCGGGTEDVADGPSPAPSPTTSVPTTPAPSATSSTPPAHETAEQFIRRWQSVADAMQLSGETATFDDLNEPSCRSCAAFRANVARIYSGGGRILGTRTQIVRIRRSLGIQYGADVSYHVRENSSPSRYQTTPVSKWNTFEGGTDTQIFYLKKHAGSWLMVEYAQLAGSAS